MKRSPRADAGSPKNKPDDHEASPPGLAARLGPGLITGAADDDPGGIATYSQAGAEFRYSLVWSLFLTWPLMVGIQMLSARVGWATGNGLARNIDKMCPRWLTVSLIGLLVVANTINIAADLAAMGEAIKLLLGGPQPLYVLGFGALCVGTQIWFSYEQTVRVLKWLTLGLFAYVAVTLSVGVPWKTAALEALQPWSFLPAGTTLKSYAAMVVAVLGTTISPYLFFWQASQEVEEEKAEGRATLMARRGATREEIVARKVDVGVGTFFSNAVMFFIILTTALTLHGRGPAHLETSRDVAQALEPLAGHRATLLYTVGLVGTGALAIPTLAGSAAYAFAELFGWREGMDERYRGAPAFYAVLVASLAAGAAMDFANVNVVSALYWSAVINGLLAPFLLVGILVVASDARVMQGQVSSRLGRVVVGLTAVTMFAAGAALFVP